MISSLMFLTLGMSLIAVAIYILKIFSRSIYAKTKVLVPAQTKMGEEGGYMPGDWVQDQLMISLIEIEFSKHFCSIEVVYNFIKGRHEVSFSVYYFVSLPHVHAHPYCIRWFGLGHRNHRRYPASGSISGLKDVLLQQEFHTSFKILSLINWTRLCD